jgi:hypothetical protein
MELSCIHFRFPKTGKLQAWVFIRDDHPVVRDPQKAEQLKALGIEPVIGSLDDHDLPPSAPVAKSPVVLVHSATTKKVIPDSLTGH